MGDFVGFDDDETDPFGGDDNKDDLWGGDDDDFEGGDEDQALTCLFPFFLFLQVYIVCASAWKTI